MKHFFVLLLCIVAFSVVAHAEPKKRIFILHSYSQEYSWTKLQHLSFVSKFEDPSAIPVDVSAEYLDTKRVDFNGHYETFFLEYLQHKYKDYKPDIIYVSDDNALTFFLHHHSALFPKVPVVFSGVNDMSLNGTLNSEHYTGVYETKEILPNIELIHQFSPQTREIWIVGDASTTYKSIESDIKQKIKKFPKYTFHFLSSERIADIIENLPTTQKTFVILTTIGGWKDEKGDSQTIKDSIDILKKNRGLVLLSMEDAYMVGGVIGGYVTSGKVQGSKAAELAIRFFNGEPFNHIHSIVKSPNIYIFDRNELIASRLILSEYTARNATILHRDKSFVEKYQDALMNILFILSIAFLIYLVMTYLIFREKKRQLVTLENQCEDLYSESYKFKTLFSFLEKNFQFGYWEWSIADEHIVYSEGLIKILNLNNGEATGIDFLLLSIYPSDKALVESMIQEAIFTLSSQSYRHKMVGQDGNIISVEQTIRVFSNTEGLAETVVGMVHKLD